jgi:predicted NBD/HSP70 family sugar kinase
VADALRAHGPRTRSELAQLTHLSRVTVLTALAELDAHGLIEKHAAVRARESGRGRTAETVGLSREAGFAAGVDIGRRHVCLIVQAIGGGRHSVRHAGLGRLDAEQPENAFHAAATLLDEALDDQEIDRGSLVCAGVGVSAPVTFDGQIGSQILGESWSRNRPLDALPQWLGCPVLLDNDANLGALAEFTRGALRDAVRGNRTDVRCMLYVKAATGIGGGIVIDGEVFRGASGTAGEIGHIALDPAGDPCRCGNRGCVELIAGGGRLLQLAQTAHPGLTDVATLVERANAQDSVCRRLVADAGRQIGTALGAVVGLYNPDAIVIGGALAKADDLFPKISDALADAVMPAAFTAVKKIVRGELGIDASSWGGIMRVRRTADLPE